MTDIVDLEIEIGFLPEATPIVDALGEAGRAVYEHYTNNFEARDFLPNLPESLYELFTADELDILLHNIAITAATAADGHVFDGVVQED